MPVKHLKIGHHEVPKGSNIALDIELPKLYNTPTKLPIRVIRGKKDGPVVFVSAGLHGDELIGIEIIRRFRKLSLLKNLRGTIILVPIVNVYGVLNLSRYFPDRRDLNRCFPGSVKGSLTSRVAKIFYDEVVSKCDFGIDLHTAAIHKSNLPQIRVNIENKYLFEMAKFFEAPVVLHSPLREGSLRAECEKNGIPILLYEAGEALRFDETCIKIGLKGIINVLRELNMLQKVRKKIHKTPVIAKQSFWIRSSESGIIRTVRSLGDSVKKHETIAYIDEAYGDEIYELKAPYDGIIIGKSEIPLVQEGDAIFHIAKLKNLESAEDKLEYFQEDVLLQSDVEELFMEEI